MLRRAGIVLATVLLVACGGSDRLTVALAILPSELPAYRAVVADWERAHGRQVLLVAQQYADIRRALAAEGAAGRGTIDLAELDVYSLAPAAPTVRTLEPGEELLDALDATAVRAGDLDGLHFLPHRLSWQALVYDAGVLATPPATWDELLAVARAHPGKIGIKGARYEGLTCDVLPFVWSAGGSGETLDDAGARAALDLFAALAPSLDPESATFKEATITEAMARGEIVLQLNWQLVMSVYASQGLAPGRIRSAPLPAGPTVAELVRKGRGTNFPSEKTPNHFHFAKRAGMPSWRAGGAVALMGEFLNLDGHAVIRHDSAGNQVVLNLRCLEQVFGT